MLSYKYPGNVKEIWGDFGVCKYEFEIWKSICLFGYDFLSEGAIKEDDFLVMLGYHEHSDVQSLINKYVISQLHDGGFMCKRLLNKKSERKSCYRASVAGLLLYAACKQKGITFENSDRLLDYFVKRDVFYTSDKTKLVVDGKEGWRYIDNFFPVESMRIGLPLILSSLAILGAENGIKFERAWKLLEGKKNSDGKLVLEGTLSKQPCSFGKVDQENKWVTFYSVLAEKHRSRL